MAQRTISGVTVKIGAETTGFQDAIKEIDRVSKNVANDLKTVSESLKLDPTAIMGYADKIKLLQEAVDVSAKKVDLAKKAIESLNKEYAEKKISPADYAKSIEALKRQLESAEYQYERNVSALRNYDNSVKDSVKGTQDFGNAEQLAAEEARKLAEQQEAAAQKTKALAEKFDALEEESKDISSQLKIVNERLKLDPNNVELVQKKMKLLKEASENASKKVTLIKEEISKLNDEYDDKSSEEYNSRLKELNKQLSLAEQEFDLAEDRVRDFAKETDNAGDSSNRLADIIKGNLISEAIKSGLKSLWDLAKDLGRALADAAKKLWSFGKSSVELAAQYYDAVQTSKRAFQEFSDDAVKFAEEQSVALGLYKGDILETMNTLGLMFSSMGLGRQDALNMSEQLVILAADIRAAFGGDMKEILDALSRGFSTSTRNLRQFGVYISEAEIKAYALKTGIMELTVDQTKLDAATIKVEKAQKALAKAIAEHGEESLEARDAENKLAKAEEELEKAMEGKADSMTSAQRQTALLGLTEERLADISGQAAAEADKYPALVNRIDAAFKDMKETIGEKLLPVVEQLMSQFLEFLQSEDGAAIVDSIADAFEKLGQKVLEIVEDGRLQELVSEIIDWIPGAIEWVGDFTAKVVELTPEIGELAERILALFGIKTEAEKSRQALFEHRKEIDELAKSYNTDTDTIITAIASFAEQNGLKFSEVVGDLQGYSFDINSYLNGIKGSYETDIDDIWKVLANFIDKHGTTMEELVSDWETNEPKIMEFAGKMGPGYQEALSEGIKSLQEFAEQNGYSLEEVVRGWQERNPEIVFEYNDFVRNTTDMKDAVIQEVSKLGPDTQAAIDTAVDNVNVSKWDTFWRGVKQTASDVWKFITTATNPNAWENSGFQVIGGVRASGGAVHAGRMYRVNDDAGHRDEWFIPNTNGYILNGDQVDRIVNNYNNSSNFSGGINVYANSYGMDLATVSEELGYAIQQKLRMSGARL